MIMASSAWAISQISQLLPLDEKSLQEILDYSFTLSKDGAADHLKNLLGDSPKALEFINSFNSRRDSQDTTAGPSATFTASSEPQWKPRKKKAPFNKLPPPRQPENHGNTTGAYVKKKEEDYIVGSRRPRQDAHITGASRLSDEPAARQLPTPTVNRNPKLPPSASGSLISDLPNVRTSTRAAPPAAKTKVNISGGSAMHGASTTLQDLDSAIRALEIQTNPSLSASTPSSARRCPCLATRHPLLAAAPNCLNCGKIICVKEGIGPCTFCSSPLLSPAEINSMLRSLREERGAEKMSLNNASQRRPDVATTPRPFSSSPSNNNNIDSSPSSSPSADVNLAKALNHRDKLLAYQSQNAQRTRVIDEAADFETPSSGQSIWSTPEQRAMQLKRQQKALRELEWNARPEYEKRKVVLSIDLVGGKVIRRMEEVERPKDDIDEARDEVEAGSSTTTRKDDNGKGPFSNNPLLGGKLLRPVWKPKEDSSDVTPSPSLEPTHMSTWRRVQDDNEDNEAWILDGGIYGGEKVEKSAEPSCG